MSVVGYDIDSHDGARSNPDEIVASVVGSERLVEGAVVVLHDDLELTAEALDPLLTQLAALGFTSAGLRASSVRAARGDACRPPTQTLG